jgi:hypothetical protein
MSHHTATLQIALTATDRAITVLAQAETTIYRADDWFQAHIDKGVETWVRQMAIALNINSHTGFTRNLLREHCGKLKALKAPKQPILVDAYSAKSDLRSFP